MSGFHRWEDIKYKGWPPERIARVKAETEALLKEMDEQEVKAAAENAQSEDREEG